MPQLASKTNPNKSRQFGTTLKLEGIKHKEEFKTADRKAAKKSLQSPNDSLSDVADEMIISN